MSQTGAVVAWFNLEHFIYDVSHNITIELLQPFLSRARLFGEFGTCGHLICNRSQEMPQSGIVSSESCTFWLKKDAVKYR